MKPVKRKGATSTKDIPPDILQQLNRGEIETANLVEWLAVDQRQLLAHLLQQNQRTAYLTPIASAIGQLKKQNVNTINEAIGAGLLEQVIKNNDGAWLAAIARHQADLVRCWAAYAIGKNPALPIGDSLQQIQVFAADTHFGVREISWMALRQKITNNLQQSITILSSWTIHKDENIRRFATEATRPRGVWCSHIETLKQQPEQALALLEPLKSDPSKYVQDSVGNWLNDAAKTQAGFVTTLCQRWEKESPTKDTQYIIKKALRTINK